MTNKELLAEIERRLTSKNAIQNAEYARLLVLIQRGRKLAAARELRAITGWYLIDCVDWLRSEFMVIDGITGRWVVKPEYRP